MHCNELFYDLLDCSGNSSSDIVKVGDDVPWPISAFFGVDDDAWRCCVCDF